MAKQISQTSECQSIINQFRASVVGTNLTNKIISGTITLSSSTDLQLALQNVNYTATGAKTNGLWTLTITFTDTYDFDHMSWINLLNDQAALTIINNYADYAESIGAIVPYNIQITVPASFTN